MYDGYTAAAYEDRYWNSYNPSWPSYHEDCTNFASQALHAGGVQFQGYGYTAPYKYWWAETNAQGGRAIQEWYNADALWWHLHNYSGGTASYVGSWGPSHGLYSSPPSSITVGDITFYDWTSDGTWDHSTIIDGSGSTTDGRSGSYIDQHTPNRYHVFWSGWTYNAYRNTTKFSFYSITR